MITARTGSANRRKQANGRRKAGEPRQPVGDETVAGYISVRQDPGDDCPTCLFIRVRADRADQRGMIALSVDEVAELRAVMRGTRR